MKTKLLFTKQNSYTLYLLLVFCLCLNYGWSQNLMSNPTFDLHGTGSGSTSDNADSYDMTPNNTILDESGVEIASPYQAIWDNDPLEDWLEVFYLGAAGSLDEQPGSTSSGNGGTRGVKLYMDTSPSLPGLCSRRIYQKVEGLTIGNEFTFSVESRSEAAGTDSEVYILNTEIADEVGINANGASDASVDGYMDITAADSWGTFSLNFTATNTFAVVYIRALGAVDGTTEVFYDNFSLVENVLSTDEFLATSIKVFPNPANNILQINNVNQLVKSVQVFDLLGKEVYTENKLSNNKINVSNLNQGIYILKLNAENVSVTKKLIIK